MIISLDRNALKALIDADPEFSLSLKQSVLAELCRRFFEKDSDRLIPLLRPVLFKRALEALQEDRDLTARVEQALEKSLATRSREHWGQAKLKPDVADLIKDQVEAAKNIAIRTVVGAVSEAVDSRVRESMGRVVVDLDSRIQKRVERLLDEHIEERVRALFAVRLGELKKVMEP